LTHVLSAAGMQAYQPGCEVIFWLVKVSGTVFPAALWSHAEVRRRIVIGPEFIGGRECAARFSCR